MINISHLSKGVAGHEIHQASQIPQDLCWVDHKWWAASLAQRVAVLPAERGNAGSWCEVRLLCRAYLSLCPTVGSVDMNV